MRIPPPSRIVLLPILAGLLALQVAAPVTGRPAVGDTLEAVLREKGQPVGRGEAGAMIILTYPDETIVLRDGKVTEVRTVSEATTVPERRISDAEKRRVAEERAAAAAAHASASTTVSWTDDYEAALSTARSQGRKVFLFFTGSDWCGWCIRLNREILSQPEFGAYAADNLVLVEIDFPRNKQQSKEQRTRNEALADKYGIRGFPSVIVLDSSGKVLGKLGYQEGGPAAFVAALNRL